MMIGHAGADRGGKWGNFNEATRVWTVDPPLYLYLKDMEVRGTLDEWLAGLAQRVGVGPVTLVVSFHNPSQDFVAPSQSDAGAKP